jgi:hypothetical protein
MLHIQSSKVKHIYSQAFDPTLMAVQPTDDPLVERVDVKNISKDMPKDEFPEEYWTYDPDNDPWAEWRNYN